MEADLAPYIGPLTPLEIEILDATLPALAMGDDTPLLQALETILHARISPGHWARYERLSGAEKAAVLDGVRAQIPLLGQG